jgi:hypothetical protein
MCGVTETGRARHGFAEDENYGNGAVSSSGLGGDTGAVLAGRAPAEENRGR